MQVMQGTSQVKQKKKNILKKKMLSNAYESIVVNGNLNYMLDRMNKVYQGQKHLLTHYCTI